MDNIVLDNGLVIRPFKAPCNITPKNIMEYDLHKGLVCVRFACEKIKWKRKGYKKLKINGPIKE